MIKLNWILMSWWFKNIYFKSSFSLKFICTWLIKKIDFRNKNNLKVEVEIAVKPKLMVLNRKWANVPETNIASGFCFVNYRTTCELSNIMLCVYKPHYTFSIINFKGELDNFLILTPPPPHHTTLYSCMNSFTRIIFRRLHNFSIKKFLWNVSYILFPLYVS